MSATVASPDQQPPFRWVRWLLHPGILVLLSTSAHFTPNTSIVSHITLYCAPHKAIMKNLLLLIVILLTGCTAIAQTDSIYVWNKWCARADSPVLFATANNVVYIHCKTIKATDIAIKSLDYGLMISPPEIKNDTIFFMAMPYPKKSKRMRMTVTNKHTQKVLRTVNFTCEEAPQPVAKLGTINGTEAAKRDIMAQSVLRVVFLNSLYSYPYYVKEYKLKSRIAGKDILIPVKGNKVTKEIMNILEIAPTGAFLDFVDIKASCPDCSPRDLPNMRVWVR